MIDSLARELGQKVIRTAVGESHVIDQGLAENAVLAGEGNGGVAALPASMTFDALVTLGLILERMAEGGESLASLVDRLPRYVMCKHEMPCAPNLVYKVLDRFRRHYASESPDCSDGVRVARPEGWLHVRASNTEPLLRIIVEAEDERRADAMLQEAVTYARRMAYGQGGA
jgi:phosphomannomutase